MKASRSPGNSDSRLIISTKLFTAGVGTVSFISRPQGTQRKSRFIQPRRLPRASMGPFEENWGQRSYSRPAEHGSGGHATGLAHPPFHLTPITSCSHQFPLGRACNPNPDAQCRINYKALAARCPRTYRCVPVTNFYISDFKNPSGTSVIETVRCIRNWDIHPSDEFLNRIFNKSIIEKCWNPRTPGSIDASRLQTSIYRTSRIIPESPL